MKNGIVIGHQRDGNLGSPADAFDRGQDVLQIDVFFQSALGSGLDRRAVGQRIRERHAELNDVHAGAFKGHYKLLGRP